MRLAVLPHHAVGEVEAAYRSERDTVHRSHLQVIWLLLGGMELAEVGRVTGFTVRWVEKLIHRWNAEGLSGLGNPGKKPLLDAADQAALAAVLEGPAPNGGLWNGRKVAEWMSERLGRPVDPQARARLPAPSRLHAPAAAAASRLRDEQRRRAQSDHAAKERALNTFYTDTARIIAEMLGLGRQYHAGHLKHDYESGAAANYKALSEEEREDRRKLIRQAGSYDKLVPPALDIRSLRDALDRARRCAETTISGLTLQEMQEQIHHCGTVTCGIHDDALPCYRQGVYVAVLEKTPGGSFFPMHTRIPSEFLSLVRIPYFFAHESDQFRRCRGQSHAVLRHYADLAFDRRLDDPNLSQPIAPERGDCHQWQSADAQPRLNHPDDAIMVGRLVGWLKLEPLRLKGGLECRADIAAPSHHDERIVAKYGERHRFASRKRVVVRNECDEGIPCDQFEVKLSLPRSPAADSKIGIARQHFCFDLRRRELGEFDLHRWIERCEAADRLRHQMGGDGRNAGDGDASPLQRCIVPQFQNGRIEFFQCSLGPHKQPLAICREFDGTRGAAEQFEPEIAFEFPDPRAQGGLRQMQFLRRTGKASALGHCQKRMNLPQADNHLENL